MLQEQPSPAHRARFLSAGGQCAGSWLGAFPVVQRLTVRPRLYWLALLLRLGAPVRGLLMERGSLRACGGCGQPHDEFGFHPSSCKAGNRAALWTIRHDVLESAVVWALRLAGCRAQAWGAANWFGSAGRKPGTSHGYLRGDVVLPNQSGPARHLFVDVAVACPTAACALSAAPSSAHSSGVAAELRAAKKVQKYDRVVRSIAGTFRAGVVERFGAMCDSLVGLFRQIAGEGDHDSLDASSVFSARSRQTFLVQHVVLATVVADAAMLESVLEHDLHARAFPGSP